ncbi:MAG: glycolate oxidase subunit GlcE [Rhodospirillales bacterium]|nr:glycolate oxidase subunit GlcE [Rhodospirillales bacterium]MBO6787098.1 glycolate oxidase subunit GlcE [Rhodospirillales bacterium]
MPETLKPETEDQLLEAVKWAVSEKTPMEVVAGGTKRHFGRPMQTSATLDMSAIAGVMTYEPEELFVTAKAGTPMAALTAALDEKGQQFSFEPPDLGPLLGSGVDKGTIGGIVATNLAGPRRIKEGAARDHLLGFHAVSGRGEVFKSGGTVVKNVTGFDLSKLMAGSFGTLAVMSQVTLKVLPQPEKIRTLLVRWRADGIYDHGAMKVMSKALGSSHDVSGAAHLPALAAASSSVDYVSGSGGGVTALRIEGPGPSVEHRAEALKAEIKDFGMLEELHTTNSKTFWREVRDVRPFVGRDDVPYIWRISVPPADGSRIALAILETLKGEVYYDWGGGQIWMALRPVVNAGAEVIRSAIAKTGGHATLVRAPADIRAEVPVMQPQSDAEAEITKKVKEGFDPEGVLNPGRMYPGV